MSKPKNMTPAQKDKFLVKRAAIQRLYREANREKVAALQRDFYEANREKVTARKRAYYEANKEKEAARARAYRDANKKKVAAIQRAYRDANKEKVAASARAYRESLPNPYVAHLLGLPVSDCPQELIDFKREQLELARLNRRMKDELKGMNHE